jgi:hypothetical protein
MTPAFELTNLSAYRTYFSQIVDEAVFLDFFAYTKEEFDKSGSGQRKGWCFILEPYTSGIRDNDADSILSFNKGMFVIALKKTNQLKSWEIEDQAQVLAHKVIGRIRRDRRAYKLRTDLSNWSMETIDPTAAAGYHGVLVKFEFYHPINKDMKYQEADWENTAEEITEE